MTRHYLNLTDGLEWLGEVPSPSFVRVESTAIERGDWCRVLRDLDADLLMHLALGRECVLYDCGTRREVSKTVSLGVPFVRDALTRHWVRGEPWRADTEAIRQAKREVMYFRRYLDTDTIRLAGRSRATQRDGDRAFYRGLALAGPGV